MLNKMCPYNLSPENTVPTIEVVLSTFILLRIDANYDKRYLWIPYLLLEFF